MQQRRLDPLEVRQLDMLEADPAACESAEVLQKIWIAGGLLADLANERQPEAAATAGKRDR